MATRNRLVGAVIAMEVELNHLLDRGTVLREERHGPWRDVHIMLGEQPVVATLAGIGMVNAAAASPISVTAFRVKRSFLEVGIALRTDQ